MNGLKYSSGASAFQAADAWLAAKQISTETMQLVAYYSTQKLSSIDRAWFTCQELEGSPVIKRVWRVCYLKEAKDLGLAVQI